MSIKGKFTALTVVPLVGIVMFVTLGWWSMQNITEKTDHLMGNFVFPLVNESVVTLNNLQASIKNMLEADRNLHQAKIAEKDALVASEDEEFKEVNQTSKNKIEQAKSRMGNASVFFDEQEKKIYLEFLDMFAKWQEKTVKAIAYAEDPEKHKFALRISQGAASRLFDEMRGKIEKMTKMQEGRITLQLETVQSGSKNVKSDAESMAAQSRWVIQIFLLIGLFVALAIMATVFFVARSIRQPIVKAVMDLSEASTSLSAASNQVSGSSQGLAEGSSEQAASLEETSSTLEEMASMTRQNSDNAKEADRLASEARDSVIKGRESMTMLVTVMNGIKRSSDDTAKIIKTIDEIAFQTNLLALNAAVEAARAGDVGRGFAVVAEEVRNLALRSAEAAKTTNDLIQNSQEKSNAGVNKAAEVENLLQEVNASFEKVGDLLNEVSTASDEQANGVEQVNAAVAQMDQVTQSTAANAEETASSSQELASQAIRLNEIVGKLAGLAGMTFQNGSLDKNGHEDHPLVPSVKHQQPEPSRTLMEKIVEDAGGPENMPAREFRELEKSDFEAMRD